MISVPLHVTKLLKCMHCAVDVMKCFTLRGLSCGHVVCGECETCACQDADATAGSLMIVELLATWPHTMLCDVVVNGGAAASTHRAFCHSCTQVCLVHAERDLVGLKIKQWYFRMKCRKMARRVDEFTALSTLYKITCAKLAAKQIDASFIHKELVAETGRHDLTKRRLQHTAAALDNLTAIMNKNMPLPETALVAMSTEDIRKATRAEKRNSWRKRMRSLNQKATAASKKAKVDESA